VSPVGIEDILMQWGVPSALIGIIAWYFQRTIDKKEEERKTREKTRETMMLMMMKSTRENTALCTAIAKAVQRIPDAHCNGDMTKALERAAKASEEEKNFLIQHGVMHIFE
jgi:hypothetical protein